MPSSSDSIGQLASALAKAQTELVNPAKTLTAVIYDRGSEQDGRSYRYAPLSAGLEIVRKILGKHELALIQTTHVDRESALVLLTTTVAHGSGEWIAASWPVCRVADLVNPRLMGAALTYARRYSLFALVGLAGEDDLDAPSDLAASERDGSAQGHLNTETLACAPRSLPQEQVGELVSDPATPVNADEPSRPAFTPSPPLAEPRDRGSPRGKRPGTAVLNDAAPVSEPHDSVRQLAAIEDQEALFRWALAILPLRNRMSEDVRATLDAAFFKRAGDAPRSGVGPPVLGRVRG